MAPRRRNTPRRPTPAAGDGLTGSLVGDYRILGELGRGGMGVVYRARHQRLGRQVALKMIPQGPFASAETVRRFRREAETAAGLDHPAIVPVYEIGDYHRQPFFTMRLIPGRSLAQRLRVGPLAPRTAARLVSRIAHAVHHAHKRGVLHLDLKPANILLDGQGNAFVTDFGVARSRRSGGRSRPPQLAGTRAYMSPEQARGRRSHLTAASDVYSLGAVLLHALTGRPPFGNEPRDAPVRSGGEIAVPVSRGSRARLPSDLEGLGWKCLAEAPRERFGSALELAEALDRWLSGRSD